MEQSPSPAHEAVSSAHLGFPLFAALLVSVGAIVWSQLPPERSGKLQAPTEVDAYLQRTFASSNTLRYEERLSQPTRIDSPILRHILPQTSFYRATLRTGYFEYPEVAMLIAARHSHSTVAYTYRLSPTFNDDQPEFLNLFAGANVPANERESVARAIAGLFATITHAGRVGTVTTEASTVTAELWHGEQLWRHVAIRFAPADTIESVHLSNSPRR